MRKHVSASLRASFKGKTVIDENRCWNWPHVSSALGYGTTRFLGVQFYAHRVAYELFVGPIPDDREIDHLCRNRACVNPDHLEAVEHRENALRGNGYFARAHRGEYREFKIPQTHCGKGHELSGDNLYVWHSQRDGRPHRYCRLCQRLCQRRLYRDRCVAPNEKVG